jgi:hypothetical protein
MKKITKPEEKKLHEKAVKVEIECYESTIIDAVVI